MRVYLISSFKPPISKLSMFLIKMDKKLSEYSKTLRLGIHQTLTAYITKSGIMEVLKEEFQEFMDNLSIGIDPIKM